MSSHVSRRNNLFQQQQSNTVNLVSKVEDIPFRPIDHKVTYFCPEGHHRYKLLRRIASTDGIMTKKVAPRYVNGTRESFAMLPNVYTRQDVPQSWSAWERQRGR